MTTKRRRIDAKAQRSRDHAAAVFAVCAFVVAAYLVVQLVAQAMEAAA